MSANAVKEREFRGEMYPCDAEDNTLMVLDFGGGVFAFVYGTFTGLLNEGWGPTFYGTKGKIAGETHNGEPIVVEGAIHPLGPHVTGEHVGLGEEHVFEDMMQLVDWIHDDNVKPIATAEHAAHVIEIIEAGLRSSDTGQVQELKTTFELV
jgi:predicted dehydrogenase